jgi:hypothetical protein
MPSAETHSACGAWRAQFGTRDGPLALKAVECLAYDGERLVAVDQCPREHWRHLRTTTVVELPCAAVRLRTTAAICTGPSAHVLMGLEEGLWTEPGRTMRTRGRAGEDLTRHLHERCRMIRIRGR